MFKRHQPLPSSFPTQPRVAGILSCQHNIMALSWHMPISRHPFRYAIAMREENMTFDLLHKHGSFTLNFLPFESYESIDRSGRLHGGDLIDKLTLCGLSSKSDDTNGNYLIDQADHIYECTIIDTYKNGDHTIFISDVVALHQHDSHISAPTLFLGKGSYATLSTPNQVSRD